jgi:hypothetical protein
MSSICWVEQQRSADQSRTLSTTVEKLEKEGCFVRHKHGAWRAASSPLFAKTLKANGREDFVHSRPMPMPLPVRRP